MLPFFFAIAAAVLAALVTFVPGRASASIVVARAGGHVEVAEARIAFARTATRTVAWEQLSLASSSGDLAWLVAVPKGAWIEQAGAHWLEALDEATAPVIAPAKALGCSALARESTASPRAFGPGRTITKTLGTLSGTAAIERLTSDGFVVDALTKARLENLERVGEEVAILYLPAAPSAVTPVVRVFGPASRPMPTTLLGQGAVAPPLRAWVFAPARAQLASVPALDIDFARLAWDEWRSNYDALLAEAKSVALPGVVVPFAAKEGIFLDQPAGPALATIPSLVRRYFDVASTSSPNAACAARASSYWASAKLVGATCPKPASWAGAPTPPPCDAPVGGSIPSAELVCPGLDDLAIAMSGASPAATWLTRLEGHAVATAEGAPIALTGLGSIPSFHEAHLGVGCGAIASPGDAGTSAPPSSGEPPSSSPYPGSSGGGGYGGSSSHYHHQDGCGTAQVFSDGCSGSSSSRGSRGDSCSGGSSSSSSDDGCSGDSSSSSGDDGCSGDSYDSSDDGCSSSSSSSSSGCASGAGDAADDGCRMARRGRLRFTPAMYVLLTLGTIARRWSRRARRTL